MSNDAAQSLRQSAISGICTLVSIASYVGFKWLKSGHVVDAHLLPLRPGRAVEKHPIAPPSPVS